jgi:hypothetical protein
MKNAIIISAGIVVATATLMAGTYFLHLKPAQELSRQRLEQQQEEYKNGMKLEYLKLEAKKECLTNAYKDYDTNWDTNCRRRFLPDNCSLPNELADDLNRMHREDRNECLTLYR